MCYCNATASPKLTHCLYQEKSPACTGRLIETRAPSKPAPSNIPSHALEFSPPLKLSTHFPRQHPRTLGGVTLGLIGGPKIRGEVKEMAMDGGKTRGMGGKCYTIVFVVARRVPWRCNLPGDAGVARGNRGNGVLHANLEKPISFETVGWGEEGRNRVVRGCSAPLGAFSRIQGPSSPQVGSLARARGVFKPHGPQAAANYCPARAGAP